MPNLVAEWHKKHAGNNIDATLLIEHFGMEAIFVKQPGFEPLMEQFIAEKEER